MNTFTELYNWSCAIDNPMYHSIYLSDRILSMFRYSIRKELRKDSGRKYVYRVFGAQYLTPIERRQVQIAMESGLLRSSRTIHDWKSMDLFLKMAYSCTNSVIERRRMFHNDFIDEDTYTLHCKCLTLHALKPLSSDIRKQILSNIEF